MSERNTPSRSGDRIDAPLAANAIIENGCLAALNAAGNAVAGAEAVGLRRFGRACASVDNTGGAAGDKRVEIDFGIFRWDNAGGGDAITRADIGNSCYALNATTVAKTNPLDEGDPTRSAVGTIFDVDAAGVWVDQR